MMLFKDSAECIRFSKIAIDKYSNLKKIITQKDYKKWNTELTASSNIEDLLLNNGAKLNILNTTVMLGYSIEKSITDSLFVHYKTVLNKLDSALNIFPELLPDKAFKGKLKNIEGFSFLATLSELTLAINLKELGFNIDFESKFNLLKSDGNRDVDITARINDDIFHFEVYMPNKQLDLKGFFNPKQDDSHFDYKVNQKLDDKFGQNGFVGLNGMTFLAMNVVFFDILQIQKTIPHFNQGLIYKNIVKKLPQGLDGLLIFEDGFGLEDSFRFINLIRRIEIKTDNKS